MSVPSDEHLRKFCQPGTETACAYFTIGAKAECAKAWPTLAAVIKARLEAGEMRAKGDNCSGPPKFASNLKLRPV